MRIVDRLGRTRFHPKAIIGHVSAIGIRKSAIHPNRTTDLNPPPLPPDQTSGWARARQGGLGRLLPRRRRRSGTRRAPTHLPKNNSATNASGWRNCTASSTAASPSKTRTTSKNAAGGSTGNPKTQTPEFPVSHRGTRGFISPGSQVRVLSLLFPKSAKFAVTPRFRLVVP